MARGDNFGFRRELVLIFHYPVSYTGNTLIRTSDKETPVPAKKKPRFSRGERTGAKLSPGLGIPGNCTPLREGERGSANNSAH